MFALRNFYSGNGPPIIGSETSTSNSFLHFMQLTVWLFIGLRPARREGGGEGWRAPVRSAQASFTLTRFPLIRISWLARHAECGHAIETFRELFEPLSLMNEMLKIRPHASHGR